LISAHRAIGSKSGRGVWDQIDAGIGREGKLSWGRSVLAGIARVKG
jgi:hypothetical protein